MMLRGNKGPVIQVDRLIFDPRNKIKPKPIPKAALTLPTQESHVIIPADQIKILRLTMEDLINDEQKSVASNLKQTISPVYESIDGRRDSIDLIQHENQFERLC